MTLAHIKALLLYSLAFTMSGCVPFELPVQALPTATPQPPTATVAFPTLIPTSTFTPLPTGSPTPDLVSELGTIIFHDDFSNSMNWDAAELAPGGISFSEGRLIVSVRQTNGLYMAISPVDPLYNAYIEVDVRPELCSDNDEFGIGFRINDSFEHYRFVLTCEGEARVVGVVEGAERIIVPNSRSTTIFPGLFLSNRLGVLMQNDQFSFFVNGEELFSDRDLALSAGRVGLLVRARLSGQTTASFDNFTVQLLQPTATTTATD